MTESEAIAFRGCFKEAAVNQSGGFLLIMGYRLLPAPNRYRKMIEKSAFVTSWGGGSHDHEAVVARQSAEYLWANPVGFEFDLFDIYLAWQETAAQ